MNLKNKADEFLQNIKVMRDNAIRDAVQNAIQTQHEPYKVQQMAIRDKELATKEQEFNSLVNQLKKEHEAECAVCRANYEKDVQAHRIEVANSAEATAKAQYDKFICGVAAVADEID